MKTKMCCGCGVIKDELNFHFSTKSKDKLFSTCIDCERDKASFRLYGIKISEELIKQNYLCACCGIKLDLNIKYFVHTDHDHNTGRFCGIVCRNCNLLIGYALENVGRLNKGLNYLLKHKSHI